jgi:hypothetical protein
LLAGVFKQPLKATAIKQEEQYAREKLCPGRGVSIIITA